MPRRDAANEALSSLKRFGEVRRYSNAQEMPTSGYYVYVVYNGQDVLQLGKGNADRMRKCVRGGLAGKHNKAFVCAIGEVALGSPNSYAAIKADDAETAANVERLVHRDLGIATNKDGATIIDGVELRSISGIHRAIWERMKTTEAYRRLDAVDRQMAEELFEIVTYGTTLVRRTSGKVTSSVQGDNLEGNILMNVGLRHLTNIFVQLTNGYLRYGKHLLSEEELANVKRV